MIVTTAYGSHFRVCVFAFTIAMRLFFSSRRFGHIADVERNGNSITGTIPVDVTTLSALSILEFSGNELSGTVPPGISTLSRLTLLYEPFEPFSCIHGAILFSNAAHSRRTTSGAICPRSSPALPVDLVLEHINGRTRPTHA